MKRFILTFVFVFTVGGAVLGQTLTASITPKQALVTVIVASKTYDGTTAATATCTVTGQVPGDQVFCAATATFDTKQAGTAKTWTATITKSGADAGNYSIPTSATGTADILRKQASLQLAALDKVYDGTIVAALNPTAGLTGIIAPDVVCVDTSGLTASFADKNVGTAKPVSVAGTPALGCADAANYTLGGTPPPPPPPPGGLLAQANLAYLGAFRLPAWQGIDANSFSYVGNVSGVPAGLVYWPAHNSLILSANSIYGKSAEVSIPAPLTGPISGLNRAVLLQPYADLLDGKRLTVDGNPSSGVFIGGYYPTANALIVSAYTYYEGAPYQQLTHFRTSLNFSAVAGNVTGPYQVNSTFPNRGGFVNAWMLPIPAAYQSALAATALTGNCCLSINARTSWGPSVTAFNPDDVGILSPVPGTRLIGYDGTHPTVGHYDSPPGYLFNGAVEYGGAVWPDGTPTVLFFGKVPTAASNYCYGQTTLDPALERQPVPGQPGVIYCYDPTAGPSGYKGPSGYPYTVICLAYDANDLIAVKQGIKQWWEPTPYATWTLTLPYDSDPVNFRAAAKFITGAAYDPATHRVFLLASYQDDSAPIVHVFQVTP